MTPVGLGTRLPFVLGGAAAKRLAEQLDVRTVGELLAHYPRRYVERGSLTELASLRVDEHVTVQARVRSAANRQYGPDHYRRDRRKVRTEVVVTDGTGDLLLTFFRQPWQVDKLRPGALGLFAGKVGSFNGRRQLLHPEYALLDSDGTGGGRAERISRPLIPVYPATARLQSWRIAACVGAALDALGDLDDPVPAAIRRRRGLLDLRAAYDGVHRPEGADDHRRAQARLRYDEALVTQVVLARRRRRIDALPATSRPASAGGLLERFDERLPFTLTEGQRTVGAEIGTDLEHDHPMHRLLQGEVGSGKTLVALRAMLQVVDAGGQAALLAPTEVLAQQHHRSLTGLLGDLALGGMLGAADGATRVRLLTGSVGAAARKQALLDAASGAAGIVVGTHALLEERVQFADLGLVVVDEQHRFGVEQRAALTERGERTRPHVLVMTATPIPRTIAMTVFGDLDTSVLAELPAGRLPVQTSVVPARERPAWLDRGWQRVREEVTQGHQAYVVCPRIGAPDGTDGADEGADDGGGAEEAPEPPVDDRGLRLVPDPDDTGDDDGEQGAPEPARSPGHGVLALAGELAVGPLAGLRVEVLHGRLPPDTKDVVMDAFTSGEIDVVVATTVVEVGVDVPGATVIVVMDADRFGLSQLHQLRGRVGRGTAPGLCLLVTDAEDGSAARTRLADVAATTDGFEVSRLDVALRREGDVLGAVQSGRRSSLRLLSVVRHEDVIADARADAAALVADDPDLEQLAALALLVDELEDTTRADFLQKT